MSEKFSLYSFYDTFTFQVTKVRIYTTYQYCLDKVHNFSTNQFQLNVVRFKSGKTKNQLIK